jgi:hypothetical protein
VITPEDMEVGDTSLLTTFRVIMGPQRVRGP